MRLRRQGHHGPPCRPPGRRPSRRIAAVAEKIIFRQTQLLRVWTATRFALNLRNQRCSANVNALLQHGLIADDTVGRTTVNSELQTFWRGIGRPLVEEDGQHTWTDEDQMRAENSWADFYAFLTGAD